MLARVVRSGVVESTHDGAVAAVRSDGTPVGCDGDVDRPFLIRSAAKPFQLMVAVRHGAALAPEQLAIGAASHGGQPIHLAYVESMLAEVGLDESALRCPVDWPDIAAARDRLVRRGHHRPRRIFHNCSGKHTAMLRACVAQGWPIESYLDPDHPLQQANRAELERMTGDDLGSPAVDGCGAPVFSVTTRGVATAYARLGTDPEYRPIWDAMARFSALTADWSEPPTGVAHWMGAAAKSGAEGLVGVSTRHDLGVAIKAWDGSSRALGPALLATVGQLGVAPALTATYGARRLGVTVKGGGRAVGTVEALVDLS